MKYKGLEGFWTPRQTYLYNQLRVLDLSDKNKLDELAQAIGEIHELGLTSDNFKEKIAKLEERKELLDFIKTLKFPKPVQV